MPLQPLLLQPAGATPSSLGIPPRGLDLGGRNHHQPPGLGERSQTQLPISETTVWHSGLQHGCSSVSAGATHCHVLRYAASALQGTPADPARTAAVAAAAANTLLIDMADLWRLPWELRHKAPFWRLVNDDNNPRLTLGWIPPARGTRGDKSLRRTAADAWRRNAFWPLGLPHRPVSAQGDQCQ